MTHTDPIHHPLRIRQRLRPARLRKAGPLIGGPKQVPTPDAIADCAACRPQTQHWRGFALTTALIAADHRTTTSAATH
ncbi:hypothetical protein LXT12_13310 [Pelomonas sp. P7]|uniref:Uncharacterized protein n=1 Tax=Pelomonas caseinilytica TaxID=2906763 RepID=A0ABS8XLX2_9BURK|nr:hypothetical protein [Pelomonas sp. P7]MCE4538230.1 hypothetical protein [Pelomonas sp. P7]